MPVPRRRCIALLAGLFAAGGAAQEAPREIEEIVVVATRIPRPAHTVAAAVGSFDRARLDWEQVRELGDIARQEPALEADYSSPRFGDSGISIRGIGGNRVALEYDGVPLPQQFAVGSFADSSRLALDSAVVGRVEILRGPASALYGSDALGGIIALSSPDPRELAGTHPGRRILTQGGYYSVDNGWSGAGTLAWAGAANGLVLSASHRAGHEADNRARGVADDEVDSAQWQAFAKWTHQTEDGGELRLSGDWFRRATDSDVRSVLGSGRFLNSTAIAGDDAQQSARVIAGWHPRGLLGMEQGVVQIYWQDNDTRQRTDERRFSGPAELLIERDFFMRERGLGGELRGHWEFDTGMVAHALVAGAEWDRQHLRQRREGLQTLLAAGAETNVILGEVFPLRDMPRSTVDEIGIYLQDELRIGRLTLLPGVRWDRFELDAETDALFPDPERLTSLDSDQLSLRFGVTLEATDWLTAYAQYAEGFRAPPPADVNLYLDIPLFNFRSLPNPDLKAEQSRNIEGGLRLRAGGTMLEAAGYRSRYDDFIESRALIGIDPVSGGLLFQSRNIEETTVYGLELELRQELRLLHAALADWSLQGGLHWARGENDLSGAALNSVAPLKAVLNLYWEPARWPLRAGLRVQHYAEQDRVDFSDGVFFVPAAATIVDLTLRWRPHPRVEWLLALNNLGNARYWRYADVRRLAPGDPRIEVASQPGLNAGLSLKLSF